MNYSINYKDLFIRIIIICLISLALALVNKSPKADLHFKIRPVQNTLDSLILLKIDDTYKVTEAIKDLKSKNVHSILISQSQFDIHDETVKTYSTSITTRNASLSFSLTPDSDGQLRRFSYVPKKTDNFFTGIEPHKNYLLNFRGPQGTFTPISLLDIRSLRSSKLKNTTVLIQTPQSPTFTTPVGIMSEPEVVATILDNFIAKRFLHPPSLTLQISIAAILLFLTIFILLMLPSTLALIGTTLLSLTYFTFSLWTFDEYSLLLPLIPNLVQITLTHLLISNYKYVLNEQTKWSLEKDSVYFHELEEMKTNFLSLFSHDLKTPLSKIIGITETLISRSETDQDKVELKKIKTYTKDLDRYIKKILKMSQVQSQQISLNKVPEDINSIIEKCIRQTSLVAKEKNIQIQSLLDPIFMAEMDGSLIQEVIINFIENAIHYSGINTKITVSSKEDGHFIRVSVTDEGPGIPKHAQESIWEKYYRFDTEKSGYGLGLYLSRYVISLHNGKVFLKSKPNEGSEFGFLIPMDEASSNV